MKRVDWETAINARRSTRNYDGRAVQSETMQQLRDFVRNLQVPFDHAVEIRFFRADPDGRLANNLKNPPPDGVAFIADTDILSTARVGFVGELFILHATSLGLSTCWFGHYCLAELERIMPHLGADADSPIPAYGYGKGEVPGKRAVCITPLGYASTQGLRLHDRMTGALMSYKRKPVDTFLEDGVSEESLPPHLRFALDLAHKAPSAANSQFWRFSVSPDQRSIGIAMPAGYQHFKWEHPNVDIGACACHFWLGLKLKDIDCQVTLSEEQGRAVWRFAIENN